MSARAREGCCPALHAREALMLEFLAKLWNSDSLSPHGICLLWRPELIWTHAISDALIGLSYLSISIFLAHLLSKRPDIKFGWVVWCFAIFILACGATHFLSILTLWSPDYGLEAFVKVITAVASVATAVLLWPLLPAAKAWPSPEQLTVTNNALVLSVAERERALQELRAEMSERVRLEEILRNSQKMEALGQLTGGLAHDFNNILAIIMMNIARVSKTLGDKSSSEIRRALDHATEAANRAAAITHRMLAFSRQAPLTTTETNVAEALGTIAPLLRDALGPKRELSLVLDDECPLIALDRGEFENAMLNLVLNARDATPHGGVVTVRTYRKAPEAQDAIRIEVTDTGSGMSPDVVEKAFDPFFTTKPVGQGSGLGLSQVFGVAKRLGGNVAIESRLNHGTMVSITLPVKS